MTDIPTITVTGVGNVSTPPDKTVLAFQVAFEDEDNAKAMANVDHHVGRLHMGLRDAGIDPELLKTHEISVTPHHEWSGDDDDGEEVFVGWNASQNLRLELGVDRRLLGKALTAIAACGVESSLRLTFEVSDREAFRAKVLEDATKSACRNARAIAEAAGCRLGKPLKIQYGYTQISWTSPTISRDTNPRVLSSASDVRPAEIQGSDSVTIIFALE